MRVHGSREPSIVDQVPAIVYTALILFLLSSAVLVRMSLAIRVGYAVSVAVGLGLPVLLLFTPTPPSRRVRRLALIAAGCTSLFLIPAALWPEGREPVQVLVDLCTTLLPIGFLVVGLTVPATFERLLEPRWALALWLTAPWAPLVIQTPEYARAFEPPDVGVIALVTTLALRGARPRDRAFAAVGLLILTALAGLSGSRSVLLIALLASGLASLVNRTAQGLTAAVLVAAALFGLFHFDAIRAAWDADPMSGAIPRALTLFRGGQGDPSASNRRQEMELVFDEIQARGPVRMVIGSGHGAVIAPEEWVSLRTISDEGFVHNVHFGPQLMLFRYGLVGLTLFVVVLLHALAVTWSCLRQRGPPETIPARLLFALGTTLFLVEFLFRSVLPNPVFSFFVAGHVAMALQASSQNSARKRAQTAA